jgi:hypothetical protein
MMAGFFRQIVQRDRTSTGRLHSAAALPFAATRDTPGEYPVLADEAIAAPIPHLAPRAIPAAADPARTAAVEAPARTPAETARFRQAPGESPLEQRGTDPVPQQRSRAARTARGIVEHVLSLAPPPPSSPIDASPSRSTTMAVVPATTPSIPATPLPAATPRGNAPPGTRGPRDVVANRVGARVRDAEPAAPEVHIHIGRVELTAHTTPPQPPRATSRERRPLSLDDYLQQQRTRRAGTP